MLIRSYDDALVEYPDELVARLLAAPGPGDQGADPDLSLEEINCLVHAMLGSLFKIDKTLVQNIDIVEEYCTAMGTPAPHNLEKARAQVKFYNESLAREQIGRVGHDTIRTVFAFQNPPPAGGGHVIEQEMNTLDPAAPPLPAT